VPADALAELDRAVNAALGRLHLAPRAGDAAAPPLTWRWEGGRDTLDGPLLPVLRAAADLLVGEARGKIRVCGGPRCGWVFVDRSRNGLRRWCRTDVCGAQAKARRHYARKRGRVAADG
jgi:predicted RNA-binding Zn ribbon-like protein